MIDQHTNSTNKAKDLSSSDSTSLMMYIGIWNNYNDITPNHNEADSLNRVMNDERQIWPLKYGFVIEIKPEEAAAGDILILDGDVKKVVRFVNYQTDYIITDYKPIGIVVVPATHTDKGMLNVISLVSMDYNNPDSGSSTSNVGMYWGGYGYDVSGISNKTKFPQIATSKDNFGEVQTIKNFSQYGYIPSDYFINNNQLVINPFDIATAYGSSTTDGFFTPSPYLNDGSRNELYHSTSDSSNCLADMNGKKNTDAIIEMDNSNSTDWQTATTINLTNGSFHYTHPAAQCCWRYHTEGTNQGEWYLPSCGQIGYFVARFKLINDSIHGLIENGFTATEFPVQNGIWTSTEYDSNSSNRCYIDTTNFGIYYNTKNTLRSVRAFYSFPTDLTVYTFKSNIEGGKVWLNGDKLLGEIENGELKVKYSEIFGDGNTGSTSNEYVITITDGVLPAKEPTYIFSATTIEDKKVPYTGGTITISDYVDVTSTKTEYTFNYPTDNIKITDPEIYEYTLNASYEEDEVVNVDYTPTTYDVEGNTDYNKEKTVEVKLIQKNSNIELKIKIVIEICNSYSYEYVDLGLPSGYKWAKCNLGATSEEQSGLYYQWGDDRGYTKKQIGTDKVFDYNSYPWSIYGSGTAFGKYTYNQYHELELEDDPVYQKLGEEWRTPVTANFQELIRNTENEWVQINGVNGRKFTASNGNYIFLPAAGYCYESAINEENSYGYLWAREIDSSEYTNGYNCQFNSSRVYPGNELDARCNGYSIRGVMKDTYADLVLWDGTKKIVVSGNDYSEDKFPASTYTPIGVVVIPASHNVHSDGLATMMSLVDMNCNTPESGSISETEICWGVNGTDISSLPKLNEIPYVGSNGSVGNSIIGTSTVVDLPDDSSLSLANTYDKGTGYKYTNYRKYAPSPYVTGGGRNPLYYQTTSPSSTANCLADFDGRGNTDKILTQRGNKDYSSWKPTYNTEEDYPAASCCDMFHTPGTNQGDWYLPSAGEFGYVSVRIIAIKNTINKIPQYKGKFWLSNNYEYWSSSQFSSEETVILSVGSGMICGREKNKNKSVRAFCRVPNHSYVIC